MTSRLFLITGLALALFACSDDDEAPQCEALGDFAAESGWQDASYAPSTTDLGCYPYNASSGETFGEFISMRTQATAQTGVDACETVFETLNCGTYSGDAGTLTFNAISADRLTMRVTGTFKGSDVDTTFYFNPCQPSCLAAVTLLTLDEDQQKICEIPSQLAVCLFPESAHNVTFARAGADSIELRLAGDSFSMARQ